MNTPPEHDLRPSTRERQRDELIAIVGHESHEGTPRRRVVPLVAAAAVLALTAGLAVGLPVLRDERRELPVNGSVKKQTDVEELSAADKNQFGRACIGQMRMPVDIKGQPPQPLQFEILDAFTFPHAKANTYTTTWVVVRTKTSGWTNCGIDGAGKLQQLFSTNQNQVMYWPVEHATIGSGRYHQSIARITVTVGTRPAMDAVLRHGYFYAPVPYARVRGPRSDSTAIPTVIRGYTAAGTLVYTSPRTEGEFRSPVNGCYLGDEGRLIVWTSNDRKICRLTNFWNFLPR